MIVDKSANLVHAAQRIVWGTFLNCGQTCVRPDFLMMHESIASELLVLLKKYTLEFYGSNPQKTEWFGRCINQKAFERLSKLVVSGLSKIIFQKKIFYGKNKEKIIFSSVERWTKKRSSLRPQYLITEVI